MLKCIRIIPRLDIKGPNLVKGIHLEGLRVLGKPERFARYYYENGADELIYMDVVASLYNRNSLLDIIKKTSQSIFIPLTVGGGLRKIEDIHAVLHAGADKVSLNTAVIERPDLISEAAKRFGSSTVVISIEAFEKENGVYEAYTNNGREKSGIDAIAWAKHVSELGAGEIIITSIDKEGTGKGFDLALTKKIAELVPIPVIAHGGGGEYKHVYDVFDIGKADAVCLASMFHYNFVKRNRYEDDFSSEGNIEYLKNDRGHSRFEGASIYNLKKSLIKNEMFCRYG